MSSEVVSLELDGGTLITEDAVISRNGVVLFTREDIASITTWLRSCIDAERDQLRPVKRAAAEWIYEAMDRDGTYTLHANGLVVNGESRGTWEAQERIDVEQLHADLLVLRGRDVPCDADASVSFVLGWERDRRAWVDEHFKTERTLTAAGRNRLTRMAGAYSRALELATTPVLEGERRARKTPTIKEER